MSDSIFVRVQRVVSGGANNALDAAERLSGTSGMRRAIREMDSAIEKARADGEGARAKRLQAAHRLQECRRQLATLKEQARFALGKDRLDLAEAAIARQLDVETQIASLTKAEAEAGTAERRLEESAEELKLRRGRMYDELRAFEAAQRAGSSGDESSDSRLQRRAQRAQEAFERAMEAAGGLSGARASPEAAAKVAELEALQKSAAIAERLAELKGGKGAEASAAAKSGRAKPRT